MIKWRGSSVGKSVGFITRRPRVQVPPTLLYRSPSLLKGSDFFYDKNSNLKSER